MKFIKTKEPMVATPSVENAKVEKKPNGTAQKVLTKPQNPFVAKPKAKGKSLPKSQRGPQVQHFCHHCGVRGHTRPNCYKLHALKKADSQRLKGQGKGNWNAKQSKGREAIKWTIYIFYLTIVLQDFLKSKKKMIFNNI